MKTIFAGSPHFAAYMLRALLDNGVEVVAVLTQPDKPKGRGLKIKANEVKILALNEGLPVLQPSSLNSVVKLMILIIAWVCHVDMPVLISDDLLHTLYEQKVIIH